ncbi:hypothetical protein CLH62_18145 [Marinobacter guineae]|uniref:DUF6998 domain-containing protein n=1 Tax=Marinobacter guineae TaxID=432303 RepID=A0A2G1VB77_9GAMM|nr:hypothetical protein [Marinobacter guineae]PHQ24037.1 hypothetical protein CLH62_18145 [Marinobacter guineae]
MALTQMQLIQSLGEAMAWFERELSWGVPPTELRHLCGRIGELYAALITNGQMATEVNQKGYDVVSGDGERISVKTTARVGTGGHVSFNPSSLDLVDRIIILQINTEDMQIETLLNAPINEAIQLLSPVRSGKQGLPLSRIVQKGRPRSDLKTLREVSFEGYIVREIENGSIEVEQEGKLLVPAKPALRELAKALNLSLLNSNGNPLNTRQLGSYIIKSLGEA